MTLYTFSDLALMLNNKETIKDNAVLRIDGSTSVPNDYLKRSVSVLDPFIDDATAFSYDETYFVSAMYSDKDVGTTVSETFSLPNTSINPLFVPSYTVDFSPLKPTSRPKATSNTTMFRNRLI